jgi:PEP-CTERM motif
MFGNSIARLGLGVIATFTAAATTIAANDIWAPPSTGYWLNLAPLPTPAPPYIPGFNTWWSNLSPPSAADSATFNGANTYSVIVNGNPPSIRDLTVSAGDVTLVNGGAVESLSVSLFGGSQSVSVTGDGTTLRFGNGSGTAVNLAAPYGISLQSSGPDLNAATLNVRDGSEVEAGNVVIGTAGHIGSLEVDGSGTLVKTTVDATSNDWGLAGGTANVNFTASALGNFLGNTRLADDNLPGTNASVTLHGGAFVTFQDLTLASVGGDGTVHATIKAFDSEVDVNRLLTIGNSVGPQGQATVEIGGGVLHDLKPSAVNASGVLSIYNNGTAFMNTVNVDGIVDVTSGGLLRIENLPDPSLNVRAQGQLIGSDGRIEGNVNNAGLVTTITILSTQFVGNVLTIARDYTQTMGGDYTQTAAGELDLAMAGVDKFDRLSVSGKATLDGVLKVLLAPDARFSPPAGASFNLLHWGSQVGAFSKLQLPALAGGLFWDTSQLYTTGVLSVGVLGDYNHDGVVDAADYTVWRDSFGQSGLGLAADGNQDGIVDLIDLQFWKDSWLNQSGSGASVNVAAPEPSTLLLLVSGILTMCSRRRPNVPKTHSALTRAEYGPCRHTVRMLRLLLALRPCGRALPLPRSRPPGSFGSLVGALRRLGRINYGRPFVTRYFSYRLPGAARPSTSLIGKQYMKRGIVRLGIGMSVLLVATLVATAPANATNYMWAGASGLNVFQASANWSPNGIPSAADTATFGLASSYEVSLTFPLPPNLGPSNITVTDMNVPAGNVTLSNSIVSGFIFPESLTVTDSLSLPNANGNASLTLGVPGFPVSLSTNLLSVQNGAQLTVRSGSQINAADFGSGLNGDLIIDGAQANFYLKAGASDTKAIGTLGGSGSLTLQNGAAASFDEVAFGIGIDPSHPSVGTGTISVTGGSTLTTTSNFDVADGNLNSTATLSIDGTNSKFVQTGGQLGAGIYVGSITNGTATINVGTTASGGMLTTGAYGMIVNRTGAVTVGSALTTGTLNINGDVVVNGGLLRIFSGSPFNFASDKTLTIQNGGTADFQSFNINSLNGLNGSRMKFVSGSLSYAGNLLVGNGGVLGAELTLDNTRQLSLTGTATIGSTLTIAGGTLNTGVVVNNGMLIVDTGTLFTGDATLAHIGTLQINIYGTPGFLFEYGSLNASGTVNLDGALVVSLLSIQPPFLAPYLPVPGDSFDILNGTLTGHFSSITLPPLSPGVIWDTSQLYSTGVLRVVSTRVPGDYNGNGIVDAADYTIWRDTLGSTYTLPNDPLGGTIGAAQYNQWRAHFGQSAASGSTLSAAGSGGAVPEPTSLSLFALSAVGFLFTAGRS